MVKKKEWCKYHNCGRCEFPGELPSLASYREVEVELEPEEIILTDQNSIINFLLMHDQYNEGMDLPSEIKVIVPQHKVVEQSMCTARNSRSKQRVCSDFELP